MDRHLTTLAEVIGVGVTLSHEQIQGETTVHQHSCRAAQESLQCYSKGRKAELMERLHGCRNPWLRRMTQQLGGHMKAETAFNFAYFIKQGVQVALCGELRSLLQVSLLVK